MSRHTVSLTDDEQRAIDLALVERADHIPLDELHDLTANNEFFRGIQKALLARGTTLLEGPRGCGKTHMMRYTWLRCRDDRNLPLGIYVSFNRYYRLEPLLRSRSDAVGLFHTWVLANILRALVHVIIRNDRPESEQVFAHLVGCAPEFLETLVGRLGSGLIVRASK